MTQCSLCLALVLLGATASAVRAADPGVQKGTGTFLSSRESLKRSLKLNLNQFVKGQKLAGMSQLNLHNSVRDPSGMNEAIAYRLFREGGVPLSSHAPNQSPISLRANQTR